MPDGTKQALLKRAVDAFGEKAVAEHLGCPQTHVRGWLAGAAPIPDAAFLKLVDLLDKQGPKQS